MVIFIPGHHQEYSGCEYHTTYGYREVLSHHYAVATAGGDERVAMLKKVVTYENTDLAFN